MASPRGGHAAPNQNGNEVSSERICALLYPSFEVRLTSSQNDNLTINQRRDSIAPETAGANISTPRTSQHLPRASSLSPRPSENSAAGSSEDTADDSFASVITVVPLQRVGRSLWQQPGSPGAAVDPPRASTDSFRSNRAVNAVTSGPGTRSRLRPREDSVASDPFVDSRSRSGTVGTTGSSTPLLGAVPLRPERAHTVQRGREQRRNLSGGRQSIETTPGEGSDIIRSPTHTTVRGSAFRPSTTGNPSNAFSASTNPTTTTTRLTTSFDINLSSPLRSRTDSTIAMKDGKSGGDDDLSKLTPGSKDKSVLGSIRRGINNLGSIRGRKTPKGGDDESSDHSGAGSGGNRGSGTPGSSTIKKKISLADMFGSLKATMTPRPRAQAAFELQPFRSEQSMIGGSLLHGPQRLELARDGDGTYAAKDKNGPLYPPRLPLEPRRGDPGSGRFLFPGAAFSRDDGPGGEASGSASRSPRPDPYKNKPLPPLPPKDDENRVDYGEWKKGGKGNREMRERSDWRDETR